ncbi:hypothetical protein B7494_g6264 [Chlorociboria aeruginascens]|nr:hypothetical protein B7494_g6264 [Chlorociboria aeruginascens]
MMVDAALLQDDMIAMMIVAEAAEVMHVMTIAADIVAMIEDMDNASATTDTPLAESTDMVEAGKIDMAVEVMNDEEVAGVDIVIVIVTIQVIVMVAAQLVIVLQQLPMVIQLLEERLVNHTEVVSALLVKHRTISTSAKESFGSAAFMMQVHFHLCGFICLHHGPKLRAAENAKAAGSTFSAYRT